MQLFLENEFLHDSRMKEGKQYWFYSQGLEG